MCNRTSLNFSVELVIFLAAKFGFLKLIHRLLVIDCNRLIVVLILM